MSKTTKATTRKKKRRINWKRVAHLLVLLLATVGIIYVLYKGAHYLYAVGRETVATESTRLSSYLSDSRAADRDELYESDVIERVSAHMTLPTDRLEVMFKIRDPAMLAGQSNLYEGVKRGDYILIYPQLVVIYDARADTVIRAAPVQ